MERREGRVVSIGEVIERNIILRGADVLSTKGFTQVPNHILDNGKLSPGAKLTPPASAHDDDPIGHASQP